MIRFRLLNWINNHKLIQYILGITPITVITLFLFFYIYDISNIYYVINKNNEIVTVNSDAGLVRNASDITKNDDGTVNIELVANQSINTKASLDSHLFDIYCVNEYYVEYRLDEGSIYVHDSVLTDLPIKNRDNTYTFTILGKTETYNTEDKLCSIYLNSEGTYTIEVYSNEGESLIKDSMSELYGVSAYKKTDNEYDLVIDNSCIVKNIDLNINYTTKLKSDNCSFDTLSRQILKNISSDFCINLLINTKYFIVILSSIIFSALLYVAYKYKNLDELQNSIYYKSSILGIILLIIGLVITLVLFI